jgi:hypothetical protein
MTDEGASRSRIRHFSRLLAGTTPHPSRCARHLLPKGAKALPEPRQAGRTAASSFSYCRLPIAYCLMIIAPSAGLLNRKPFIFFIIPRSPKIVKHYFGFFEHFFGVFPFFPKNFCSIVREKAKILLSGKNRFSGSLCRKRACLFAKS